MSVDQMDCDELVELVTDYLDGGLDAALWRRFEAHLGECDGCEVYVGQFRATIATVGRTGRESLDDDFRRRLLDCFGGPPTRRDPPL